MVRSQPSKKRLRFGSEVRFKGRNVEQLIVGVKRGLAAPKNWQAILHDLAGVRVLSPPNDRMARIEVTPEAEQRVRAALGRYCHVEHLIEHTSS